MCQHGTPGCDGLDGDDADPCEACREAWLNGNTVYDSGATVTTASPAWGEQDQQDKEYAMQLIPDVTRLLSQRFCDDTDRFAAAEPSEGEIQWPESETDGAYADTETTATHYQDYSGVDVVVDLDPYPHLGIGNRVRPYENAAAPNGTSGFSMRWSNGLSKPSEFHRYMAAYRDGVQIPVIEYAFGRHDGESDPSLVDWYMIDPLLVMAAVDADVLDYAGPFPARNGDGTEAVYFDVQDLRDAGCLTYAWDSVSGGRIMKSDRTLMEQGCKVSRDRRNAPIEHQ